MKYTDLTEQELADNFERVAGDFYKFIKDNGLESTEVTLTYVTLQLVTEAGLLLCMALEMRVMKVTSIG